MPTVWGSEQRNVCQLERGEVGVCLEGIEEVRDGFWHNLVSLHKR